MVSVTVTSAQPLSKEQLARIVAAVEKKHGKNLTVKTVTDESLIGGLKVQVGSTEFDGSVSGALTQLRQELTDRLS